MENNGIVKRVGPQRLDNLNPFRGTNHSMHRKDGQVGSPQKKDGPIGYQPESERKISRSRPIRAIGGGRR